MATLYCAEHVHIAQTQAEIPIPNFCIGREILSPSPYPTQSCNVNEPFSEYEVVTWARKNKEEPIRMHFIRMRTACSSGRPGVGWGLGSSPGTFVLSHSTEAHHIPAMVSDEPAHDHHHSSEEEEEAPSPGSPTDSWQGDSSRAEHKARTPQDQAPAGADTPPSPSRPPPGPGTPLWTDTHL